MDIKGIIYLINERGIAAMKQYVCTICGYVYDEAQGIPEDGIAPGTKWEDIPEDWACPICGAEKSMFTQA